MTPEVEGRTVWVFVHARRRRGASLGEPPTHWLVEAVVWTDDRGGFHHWAGPLGTWVDYHLRASRFRSYEKAEYVAVTAAAFFRTCGAAVVEIMGLRAGSAA